MINGTVKFYNGQKGLASSTTTAAARTCSSTRARSSAPACHGLNEDQKVSYDTQEDHKTGKIAVGNIQAA
jgi:cold shock protein